MSRADDLLYLVQTKEQRELTPGAQWDIRATVDRLEDEKRKAVNEACDLYRWRNELLIWLRDKKPNSYEAVLEAIAILSTNDNTGIRNFRP